MINPLNIKNISLGKVGISALVGRLGLRQILLSVLAVAMFNDGALGQEPPDSDNGASADTSDAVSRSATENDRLYPERYLYRQKGLLAFEDGIYDTAARFFLKYRQGTNFREPDFTDATILLIRALLRQDDVEAARQALNYYEKHSPGIAVGSYAETFDYWRIAVLFAEDRLQEGIAAAKSFLNQAEARDLSAGVRFMMANAFIEQKDWDRAVATLRRLITNYPQADRIGEARFRLAYVYLAQGEGAKAQQVLEQVAAQAQPGDPRFAVRLQIYRALRHAAQGELEVAVKLYKAIADRQPPGAAREWWLLLSHLVSASLEKGEYQLAAELAGAAETAAEDREDKVQMRLYRTEALIKAEELEAAVQSVDEFAKDYADTKAVNKALFNLALFLRKQKEHKLAAEYFQKVAANEDTAPRDLRYQARLNKGWALKEAGSLDDAVAAFAAAARLGATDTEQAQALFFAGNIATHLEDYGDAAMYYQNVADNYPQSQYAEQARFRQAQARAMAGLYSDAAMVYRDFLKKYPNSPRRAEALLERGIALKKAGNYQESVTVFQSFAEKFPDHAEMPRALLEGFSAAKAQGEVRIAFEFIDALIAGYPDSDLYVHALYHRIHYHFLQGHGKKAMADAQVFMKKYARLPLSADVNIWVGDYLANEDNYGEAEDYYLAAANNHPNTIQAQIALYEAGRCARRLGKTERAATLLEQFISNYEPQTLPNLHARALMLRGDIRAETGAFQPALELFRAAEATAEENELKLGAAGRIGDMLYSLATQSSNAGERVKLLQQAIGQFTELQAEAETAKLLRLRQKARYRLAKCFEKNNEKEKAIDLYLDIFYGYQVDLPDDNGEDWYYFTRSGYDAARLLMLQNSVHGQDNLKNAARIYERIARSGVPTANEAGQRARELRKKLADAGASP